MRLTILRFSAAGLAALSFGLVSSSALADTEITIQNAREQATSVVQKVLDAYEKRIRDLETENSQLRAKIATLQGTGAVVVSATGSIAQSGATATGIINTPNVAASGSIATLVITGTESLDKKYRTIMQRVQDNKDFILRTNDITGTGASIGLFEFIEPDAFFVSLDDGKNPAGQTAFRRKVLYNYDTTTYDFRVVGIFDFDFTQAKYVTKFGANPHANSVRTKVKNPYYAGKLLETTPTVSSGTASISGSGSTATSTTVTIEKIKSVYAAGRITEAIALADTLLATDSNNVAVRKIRYRGLFELKRYAESLAEIEKVQSIQGSSFEKAVGCEGEQVAKALGNTEKQAAFAAICRPK